jgi:hypothetical protein
VDRLGSTKFVVSKTKGKTMLATELNPAARLTPYNPRNAAPHFEAPDHNTKRAQFQRWIDRHYPTDITMRREDLREFLAAPFGHRGAFFITLFTRTPPRMAKGGRKHPENPYFGRVEKRSHVQVIGGWNYENAVNNARARLFDENDGPIFEDGQVIPPVTRSGDPEHFTPEPRQWGDRLKGLPFVVHTKKGDTKETYYFEAGIRKVLSKPEFRLDGEVIDKSLIAPWLQDEDAEATAKHQGLTVESRIILRDYKVDNIHALRFCGRTIFVID